MEQRVLVQVGEGAQRIGRRAVPEERPDARTEGLGQIQVDRPDGPVEVDLAVHEQPGGQEHLERAQPRLVERQAALADERVAPQPLDVDRPDGDPGEVGVAPDVVEVVDREDPGQERLQPADPERHRRVGQGRLGDEERDPARVDRLGRRRRRRAPAGSRAPGAGRR